MANLFDDLVPQPQSAPQRAPGGRFDDLVPQGGAPAPSKASATSGLVMGLIDPINGGAQLLTHVLPDGVVKAGNEFNNWLADKTGLVARIPQGGVDQMVREREQAYQAARQAAVPQTLASLVTGEREAPGFDWGRLAGNLLSPANLALAEVAPVRAASTLGKIVQGARAGAAGSALAPVTGEEGDFAREKLGQIAAGATGGAALTPIAGKVGEAAVRRFVKPSAAALSQEADRIINAGIERLQREGIALHPAQLAALRQQVTQALHSGVEVDAAALARRGDFEALGMQPTLGQITRNAAQFSREKNLRGVAGVGDPLLARFDEQARRVQELVSGRAAGAADDYTAGGQMISALRQADEQMNGRVGAAYDAARDHLGRAAPMDSAAFSRAANEALDEQMLGSSLPKEARKILNDVTLGKIPLNVNSAVLIDRRLSALQRDAQAQRNGSAATALGVLRDELNRAPIADNVGEDAKAAFDAARGLARERFRIHEMVPAMKAAVDGDVAAQDFARRFLINGKADEVARMAQTLPPEMQAEARRQFGAALERAAFGANVTGDKGFSQEAFNRFLNQPGMRQKLAAFFSPQEVEELFRVGRVGAYIGSFPANSTVNTSNTAAALANLVNRIPGLPAGVGLLQSAKNAAGNYMAVNSALRANPAQRASNVSPEQMRLLSRLLGVGTAGAAGAAGVGLGD